MNLITTSELPFASPISGVTHLDYPGIARLNDLTADLGILHLRGPGVENVISRFLEDRTQQDSLVIGESRALGIFTLCRLAKDEFLILMDNLDELGTIQDRLAGLASGAHAALSDLSHGYGKLELFGAGSTAVLPRVCGLDFSESGFPNGRIAQTSLAKVHATLMRLDGEAGAPRFIILVDRSLSAYAWEVIKAVLQDFKKEREGKSQFN
jgi:heterotetrameric sarcosine oxidase gamma subunit